ncbi:MAG: hypothetical protein IKL04_02770 [Lachnospiraceae bacterium]|nr:hypothetical protein [Lachnospiraceae bacterium]
MDNFIDKIAHRFTAQEVIKANSAAEAAELDRLKAQMDKYNACVEQMEQLAGEMKEIESRLGNMLDTTMNLPKNETDGNYLEEYLEDNFSEQVAALIEGSKSQMDTVARESMLQVDAMTKESLTRVDSVAKEGMAQMDTLKNEGLARMDGMASEGLARMDSLKNEGLAQMDNVAKGSLAQMDNMVQESLTKVDAMAKDSMAQVSSMASESLAKLENFQSESMTKLETLQQRSIAKLESFQQKSLDMDAIGEVVAARGDKIDESVHKECVKVYRNVQAVVNEETNRTMESMQGGFKTFTDKLKLVMIISSLAAVLSAGALILQVLTMMNII